MSARPAVRNLALTVHVSSSVGWLGAVLVVMALGVVVATGSDGRLVGASYLVMDHVGRWVLVPLAATALVSGVAQSLASPWGLFRHWWVVVKLALTAVATAVLLLYTATLARLADAARTAAPDVLSSASPLVHASGALAVLLGAVVLSVCKPRGLTPYGWRVQRAARARRS